MKLPKNYFNNLTASKYREYLKLLPNMQQEKTRIVTTLIFTFFAMSFFGIFAINPTLSTIVTLRKQLEDNQLVYAQLKTKIQNLSSLAQQYSSMQEDMPIILEAIPQSPNVTSLLGKIMGLAREKKVTIVSINTSEIHLIDDVKKAEASPNEASSPIANNPVPAATLENSAPQLAPAGEIGAQNPLGKPPAAPSYTFSLSAKGSYEDLLAFTNDLTRINRIITVESLSLNRDPKQNILVLNLGGKAYFKK